VNKHISSPNFIFIFHIADTHQYQFSPPSFTRHVPVLSGWCYAMVDHWRNWHWCL